MCDKKIIRKFAMNKKWIWVGLADFFWRGHFFMRTSKAEDNEINPGLRKNFASRWHRAMQKPNIKRGAKLVIKTE